MQTDVSFRRHLRREVDHAGRRFEKARDRVEALTPEPGCESGPMLLEATELLATDLHVYICALRRLAYYAAHEASQQAA